MRSIPRRLEIAFAAIAIAIGAPGCSNDLAPPIPSANPEPGATPRRGGILTTATFGDIRAFDPANISDGIVPQILENVFAGLVDYGPDGKLFGDLAESWTAEDEGKTYRFVIRHGVRFHDGEELTADDVVRSTERALHPSAPNPYTTYFESIVGYPDFVAKKTEHLAGVEALGRYVVAYHLKQPDATFLPVLAMPILRPVCKSAGARFSDEWHACGAGPFKLPPNGWDHGRSLTIVRHDGYFRPGLPYLDGFRFLFHVNQLPQRFKFEHGELDVARDFLMPDTLRFQTDPRWKAFGEFEADKQILGESMNTEMAPFDNVWIRRAVAAAIDREQIVAVRAANLHAAYQPIPPAVFGFDPDLDAQKYDYEKALEYMRRAGYPYDPVTKTGGWPHVVPYDAYAGGFQAYSGQIMAQQLAKIGIRITLHIVNYPTLIAIRGRRHTSAFGPAFWTQDYPDGESFLEPLFHSKSINDEDSNNWSFYKNPRYDEIVDRAHRELDDDRRKKLYSEASKIVCDDAPWAFTINYRWWIMHQPYVRDWRAHPVATFELSRVWLDRPPSNPGASVLLERDPRHALASFLGGAFR